ncbi:MAG: sigma-70 family RNA polymerase sigma factor [Pirellulales bacterium]
MFNEPQQSVDGWGRDSLTIPGTDPAVMDAVRAVLAGHQEAFAVIVRQYQSAIMTLAIVLLRDRQAATEVTQEVFVSAWRGLKTFDQTRPMKTWLLGIAYHAASDYKRKRAIRAKKERTIAAQDGWQSTQEPPLDVLIASERSRTLWKLIDALPLGEQPSVILFYREGLSVGQVAQSLGVSPGTVKTSLFRARKHLHTMMQARSAKGLEIDGP